MMSRKNATRIMVVVVILFLVFAAIASEEHRTSSAAAMEVAFSCVLQTAGCIISIFAAILLFELMWQRDLRQIMPVSIFLSGGLLVFSQHWGVAILFGALILAYTAEQAVLRYIPPPAARPGPTVVQEESPPGPPPNAG